MNRGLAPARRWVVPLVAAVVASLGLAAVGLCLGKVPLGLDRVLAVLTGTGSSQERFVVLELRVPRVATALLVGALLAGSGMLFQAVFRNPLVSPDFVGIETGASAAAVAVVVLGWSSVLVTPAAFFGAMASALIVYSLGGQGRLAGTRLVLIGVGMNALLTALVSFLLVKANVYQAAQAYQWMVGSLFAANPAKVALLAGATLLFVPAALALVRPLKVLQLGDLGARSLGLAVGRVRLGVLLVASALAGVAVSVVGPIGFIALAVPHLARMVGGPLSSGTFALASVLGGLVLLATDLVGQHLLPWGLPVGVLAAALGAPYFLFLLRRRDLVA